MNIDVSESPSSAQLLNLYNQASSKGLLNKTAESLFLRMANGNLCLEKKGIFSWLNRVVLRRADSEYNFIDNLTKFQALLEGSLLELQKKKVDKDVVQKIQKLVTMYNDLLVSKKSGDAKTRFDRYVERLSVQADVKSFTADRVIKQIPDAAQDPVYRFIKSNFHTLIPQTSEEGKRLDLSIALIAKDTAQYKSISEPFKRLERRIGVLNSFHPVGEAFTKAQELLRGAEVKTPVPGGVGLGRMISLVNSVNQSLDPVIDHVFKKELDELQGINDEFTALHQQIAEQNARAQKIGYPKNLEIGEVEDVIKELDELLKGHDEKQLQGIGDKIAQIRTRKAEEEKKLSEFLDDEKEFQSLIGQIVTCWQQVGDLKKYGPIATIIAGRWIQELLRQSDDLKKNGLQEKPNVEKVLSGFTEEKFRAEVHAELERQQAEIEKTVEFLVFPPVTTKSFFGSIASKILRKSSSEVAAEANRTFGIAKLFAEVDKALAWNKLLCGLAVEHGVSPVAGVRELQESMGPLLKDLKASKPPSAEKLGVLFADFKKMAKINTELQTVLETGEKSVENLELMYTNARHLGELQEEVDILEPLLEGNDLFCENRFKEMKEYCGKTWGVFEEKPEPDMHILEDGLKNQTELVDLFIPMVWIKWHHDDPKKAMKDYEFGKMDTQAKCQYLARMSNK
jgi:hypothetical protein